MNTTQQNSHGGDELPLDRIARFTDDYIECWQDDNTTDQDLRDLQDNLRIYFEQLATRRAVELLRRLKAEADTPFQNAKQTIYVELDKAERKLTAELKGDAK